MGTIAISTLEIGSMLIGGLIGKFLIPKSDGSKCCSAEDSCTIRTKINELREQLSKLEELLG